jgi:putative addiction module component (TIGR02574 family)
MSKNELLKEFVKLTPAERDELWEALWTLEERHVLGKSAPTPEETAILDSEMEEYERDPQPGSPWPEVEARLRTKL